VSVRGVERKKYRGMEKECLRERERERDEYRAKTRVCVKSTLSKPHTQTSMKSPSMVM
jgi:hypothetical protein